MSGWQPVLAEGGGPLGGTRKGTSNSLPNIKLTKHLPLSEFQTPALGLAIANVPLECYSSLLKDSGCLITGNVLSGAFQAQKGAFQKYLQHQEALLRPRRIATKLGASRASVGWTDGHLCTHPSSPTC